MKSLLSAVVENRLRLLCIDRLELETSPLTPVSFIHVQCMLALCRSNIYLT